MIVLKSFSYKEHPLTFGLKSNKMDNLSEDLISTLKEWDIEWCDKVITAYDKDILVGFFRYDLGHTLSWLYAAGTYIIPEYRKQNIAFDLWNKVITIEKPNKIFAHIASYSGLKFIQRIKKEFPKISYDYSLDKKVIVS